MRVICMMISSFEAKRLQEIFLNKSLFLIVEEDCSPASEDSRFSGESFTKEKYQERNLSQNTVGL